MKSELIVSHLGLDNHRAFSRVTARDAQNRVVWRQRLEHRDRQVVRTQLRSWPAGTPVILECTFGWAWMSAEALRLSLWARNRVKGKSAHTVAGAPVPGPDGRSARTPVFCP